MRCKHITSMPIVMHVPKFKGSVAAIQAIDCPMFAMSENCMSDPLRQSFDGLYYGAARITALSRSHSIWIGNIE